MNLSIQTQYFRESLIFASSHPLALKCLNWQSLHEFSLNTDINVCCSDLTCARALSAPGWWWSKCSYSSIWHSHWTRVNGLSTCFFFHRCCCNVLGSQNAHPSTEAYISQTLVFFYMLFITNHIADALSDLSWTTVLACAEPFVKNCTVRFFSANRSTPSIYMFVHLTWPIIIWRVTLFVGMITLQVMSSDGKDWTSGWFHTDCFIREYLFSIWLLEIILETETEYETEFQFIFSDAF